MMDDQPDAVDENPHVLNTKNGKTSLRVAAVQMDASPASTAERLARAQKLVESAAKDGAQLVLLPECFNTGYTFSEENHRRVETADGLTATWLCETAARHKIHLAGSLMLLDQGDVFNTLLLYAPDGRMWRYDKNYPWGNEYAYFRGSRKIPTTVAAETDIGRIGMLICWDVSHLDLWRAYAGRVDLMLIASCPVDVGHATYHFPNGDWFTLKQLGRTAASMTDSAAHAFGDMIDQQTAWLGVPSVHAIDCGHLRTDLPLARRTLMTLVPFSPGLLRYFPQANGMQMSCDLVHECKVVDGSGAILASLTAEDGETYLITDVQTAPSRVLPRSSQPASLVPAMTYFIVDRLVPAIVKPIYHRGQRLWRNSEYTAE